MEKLKHKRHFNFFDFRARKLISNAKAAIALPSSFPNRDLFIDNAMNDMYDYFSAYSEDKLSSLNLQMELFEVEQLLAREYLPIDTRPSFNDSENSLTFEMGLIDRIIYETRKKLSKHHDLSLDPLDKCCIGSSLYLDKVCDKLGVEFISISVNQSLQPGIFHQFTIIKLQQPDSSYKFYLADCAYRQFFTKNNSNPHRIGVMRGPASGCSIGAYMLMNERRINIAKTILSKGYIELTPEVFKEYFDSIIYSGRSKAYYEANGLNYLNADEVAPTFSVDDYLDILRSNGVINETDFLALSSKIGCKATQRST